MWLIVGLGNPGSRYQGTRHNIGFDVIDELCRRHMRSAYRTKYGGEAASGEIRGFKALLLKPMEFMNRSGFAIQRAAQFHRIPPERIIVVHDDLDLPPGKLRLKNGGGHGGNNGLRSTIQELGTNDFLRIRIGIGKPDPSSPDRGAQYVLSSFPPDLLPTMETAVTQAANAAEEIMSTGIIEAMNQFNGR